MGTLSSMSGSSSGIDPSRLYDMMRSMGVSHSEAKDIVDSYLHRQRSAMAAPQMAYYGGLGSPGAIMPSTMTTSTLPPLQVSQDDFEVGDEVSVYDNSCGTFTGILGEIDGSQYYVWQNNHQGSVGQISPSTLGFIGSWSCSKSMLTMKKKKTKAKTKLTFDPTKLEALVIKDEAREEIVAVLQQHKNHDKLFDEWGLGEIIEYGKGMTFMFYGGPGTGKTYGATCIAKALGTELLILSASEIQSSEPGGANRAIQEAFKEAKKENKIIFLDECDSLIASRNDLGMVLASEVNTLLTEIEKFEGVAILATNRIEHMDEALERRISLIVEFPKPDFVNRVKIWTKLLPKKMPLGKGISIETLAKEELTGGQIKNVVLQAARMALAGDCKQVEQKHFDLALARIKKSKNLMGSASRYHQGMIKDDFAIGHGTKTKSRLTDFLKTKSDDIDIDTDIDIIKGDKTPKKT